MVYTADGQDAKAGSARRARGFGRASRSVSVAAALLSPSLLLLLAFTYWPLAQVVWRSLVVQAFGEASRYGFDNYVQLWRDPHFQTAAWNNLVYAVLTVVRRWRSRWQWRWRCSGPGGWRAWRGWRSRCR
jgi:hypothetical protein